MASSGRRLKKLVDSVLLHRIRHIALPMNRETLHVLLIENDAGDALRVEHALWLGDGRFELAIASTLERAIQQLAARSFHVVLLDVTLPDSSGLDGVAIINEQFPEMPVVVLTELADDQLALDSLDRGAQDYLVKGQTSGPQLERTLRHAIQRHQIQCENQRLVGKLEHMAHYDSLTQLLNRRSFNNELEREWRRSTRLNLPLACVMLDADFFKRINDTSGHAAGDEVLRTVAELLRNSSRATDRVARFGGEEFCVLLPDTNEQNAVVWAERVREQIADAVIDYNGNQLRMTASFGVAQRLPDTTQMTELVSHSDEALLVAKQLGRNQVVAFGRSRSISGDEEAGVNDVFDDARAGDVMMPLVIYLRESHSYEQAVELLLASRLESLPIVDGDGKFAGLVTEEDLTARLLAEDAWQSTLMESVARKTVSFRRDVPLHEIGEFLRRAAVRQVVVVDARDRPIGIISGGTILRWLRNSQSRSKPARTLAAELSAIPSALGRISGALDRLQEEVNSLQGEIQDAPEDPATSLIGGATRIQALLDESLTQAHRAGRVRDSGTAGRSDLTA
jgi:diguanylate cyclase (GGDEF)-like protein